LQCRERATFASLFGTLNRVHAASRIRHFEQVTDWIQIGNGCKSISHESEVFLRNRNFSENM
jgi:hypothetical protein